MKKIVVLSLVIAGYALAQIGSAQIMEIEKETNCQHIRTTVCVFDSNGWYIPDLELSNFTFLESGSIIYPPNVVQLNECLGGCVDIAILLDLSGSMDDDVIRFSTALSVFTDGLHGVDYRIIIAIFNGCPAEWDGVRRFVRTNYSLPPPCTTGTDYWATNPSEFSKLFASASQYFLLPWSLRGSGHEDQFGALRWAIDTIDWRPTCKRAVVMFTDEEVQLPIPNVCFPAYSFDDASLYAIMNYCWAESIIFYAVCPEDSNMVWYPLSGDSPDRQYYAGYRILAESTDGIWSNLYDTSYPTMVTSLAEAIANIPCCYSFRFLSSAYCMDLANLEVRVNKSGEFIGADDSFFVPFCTPEIVPLIPSPCKGITSCAYQPIIALFTNSRFGELIRPTISFSIDGSPVPISAINFRGDTLSFVPSVPFTNGDTVIFRYNYFQNIWGCVGTTPPCTFYVDLEPPYVIDRNPAPFDTVFIWEASINAYFTDAFSGVNSLSIPGRITVTMDGEIVETTPPRWTHFGATHGVHIDSLRSTREGLVNVCVGGIYDSPTYSYCPPNVMPDYCWQFYVATIARNVGFPIMSGYPCDTVLIPLSIDGLEFTSIARARMNFKVDPRVLIPIGIVTSGALTDGWSIDSINIDPASGTIFAVVYGSALSGGAGGNFLFLKARVPCTARGGQFTSIDIHRFGFNQGFPAVRWTGGFFFVELIPRLFSCDLRLNRTIGTPTEDHIITFGANYSASDAYNPGVDVVLVPPPDWMVTGWFDIDDPTYPYITRLQRDMRYPSPPVVWSVITDNETYGIVRWEPSCLPEGEFRMNRLIDMKRDSVANFGWDDTLQIVWNFPELEPVFVHLGTGWNLVSCPVLSIATPPNEFFINRIGVFRYRSDICAYDYARTLREGEGYWVWSDSDTMFMVAGGVISGYRREIQAGWNIIGAIGVTTVPISSIYFESSGAILGIWGYDGSGYLPADSLETGKGYWLLASRDGVLHVPSGFRKIAIREPKLDWLGYIEISNGAKSSMLEFGISPDVREGLDIGDIPLLPLPPGVEAERPSFIANGIELARDLSSTGHWEFILKNKSSIKIDIPENIDIEIDGEIAQTNTFFELSAGLHRIDIRRDVPQRFAILRCVPNPFNARTDIIVAIENNGEVDVEIFDISARLVWNKKMELQKGISRIAWNGDNNEGAKQPSGLYFVRVTSGNRTVVHRAMLIK